MSDLHKIHNAILSPAYGRDYTSRAAAVADFNSGKDFKAHNINGQPLGGVLCSIRDCAPTYSVTIRYAKMQRMTTVTVRNTPTNQ